MIPQPQATTGGGRESRPEITNLMELTQGVTAFYNTTDKEASKELQAMLNRFQQKRESWRLTLELVKPTNNFPSVVQFYGAKALYDSILARFEQISESTESTEIVKAFLVQSLSAGARTFTHSVLNKLSSALAVFMLKCIPDIWPNAFKELIDAWGQEQPELLLRVLAEVAAEYPRLTGSLRPYKGILKIELAKVSSELVRLARDVLMDPAAPASLKNAAVECIELWLKLPGMKLAEFMDVFIHVFNNIAGDVGALSRILSTLKSNEEMAKYPQLINQISTYLATFACPTILSELANVLASPDNLDQMGELTPLIVAVVEFSHEFLGNILSNAAGSFGKVAIRDQSHANVYVVLCEFFLQLSTVKGIYPTQENISDLPEPFWSELKEQLIHIDNNKAYAENKKLIRADSVKYFLQLLSSAIEKIAYVPNIEKVMGRSELEQFEAYRITRGDVSSNAMQLAAVETSALLANTLSTYLTQQDIHRSEATLYYIKEAYNFLKEKNFVAIMPVLCNCGAPINWPNVALPDLKRYGTTLMDLLRMTEHLLLTIDGARDFLPTIASIIMAFLNCPGVDEDALETLTVLMKHRDSAIQVVLDQIVTSCFAYYSDKQKPEAGRIAAVKCVGMGLSYKPIDYIRSNLDKIVAPSFIAIQSALAGGGTQRQKEAVVLFELTVVEQLVATLEANQRSQGDINSHSPTDAPTPVRLIMDEAVKLFNAIFASGTFSAGMVTKICDVLRAGVNSLYTSMAPLLPSYMYFLDNLIFHYPVPACAVAKAVFLDLDPFQTFRQGGEVTPFLVKTLSKWFVQQSKKYTSGAPFTIGDQEEQMQELAYQVIKKNWASLVEAVSVSEECAADVGNFLQSVLHICVNILAHGRDASMIRESLHTIALVLKNCLAIDKPVLRRALENMAEQTIAVVFRIIDSELISMQTPAIAEVLHLFAKSYPSQTRAVIAGQPGGDSQGVAEMFAQVSAKNFRLRVSQMHIAAMRGKGINEK